MFLHMIKSFEKTMRYFPVFQRHQCNNVVAKPKSRNKTLITMNRVFLILGICLFSFGCKNQEDFVVAQTCQEPHDRSPNTKENRLQVPEGLQASITTTDIRFVQSETQKI
jgi:hypothetical protein